MTSLHRKVLIVEQSDTIRSAAESVLRQNGYEVIAVIAAGKAIEVLEFTKPDMIVIGADLQAPDGHPFYDQATNDARLVGVPMLLFESATKAAVDLPPEVIVSRPFDPKEFLEKVSVFLGQAEGGQTTPAPARPISVDDEFLDAALGLDQIDVVDSEVMDKTFVGSRRQDNTAHEKMIGLDTSEIQVPGSDDSSKIESVVISDDSSQIKRRTQAPAKPLGASGKIEILTDSYGLSDPAAAEAEAGSANQEHDYDWFVDAIKQDVDPAKASPTDKGADSGRLHIKGTAAAIDPITPPPATSQPAAPPSKAADSGGVEKFIDLFKREIEQIRDEDSPPIGEVIKSATAEMPDAVVWQEQLEKLGPEQVKSFLQEFAQELGRTVAKQIVGKIDPDKLLNLIRDELVQRAGSNK